MPQQTELEETMDWREDAMETDYMSDDDFDLDDLVEDESDEIPEETASAAGSSVPLWRLIEMSRENRFLARELADFEDYDSFDSNSDSGADNYMH